MHKSSCHHKTWVKKKDGFEYCTDCHAEFPCKRNCIHVDCVEARGSNPACSKCRKEVTLEDAVFVVFGKDLAPMCKSCV